MGPVASKAPEDTSNSLGVGVIESAQISCKDVATKDTEEICPATIAESHMAEKEDSKESTAPVRVRFCLVWFWFCIHDPASHFQQTSLFDWMDFSSLRR
jgi:hypothetical protein